ncbi:MAG: hypothetical protein EOO60_05865 [Hymenobacter sp.]|nr:MAG: hypothetical protein EOO60_05865 [Hymenobacter sp.]
MNYPVYYKLSFNGFTSSMKFVWKLAKEEVIEACLSPQETTRMKEILISDLMEYNEYVSYSEYERIDLDNFGIQYVAYYNKKREKIIWINGFNLNSNSHSLADAASFELYAVCVLGGGNEYFEISINLTTGEATGIQIHGSS